MLSYLCTSRIPYYYFAGVSSMRLAQDESALPSARLVSSTAMHPKPNDLLHPLSVLFMTYGQFLDHDLTFAPVTGEEARRWSIFLA